MAVNSRNAKGFVRYSGMAFEMIAIIGIFTFAGWKLDQWTGNKFPVFVLTFSLSGVCIGIYTAIKGFLKGNKDKK
ncbi:MAG: AtpZ/AtpI family protein [Lentimicrobiaceae bacterium]|nr:AtpZ/AtpI family protein [Lentimicrobiaceae bacterium]